MENIEITRAFVRKLVKMKNADWDTNVKRGRFHTRKHWNNLFYDKIERKLQKYDITLDTAHKAKNLRYIKRLFDPKRSESLSVTLNAIGNSMNRSISDLVSLDIDDTDETGVISDSETSMATDNDFEANLHDVSGSSIFSFRSDTTVEGLLRKQLSDSEERNSVLNQENGYLREEVDSMKQKISDLQTESDDYNRLKGLFDRRTIRGGSYVFGTLLNTIIIRLLSLGESCPAILNFFDLMTESFPNFWNETRTPSLSYMIRLRHALPTLNRAYVNDFFNKATRLFITSDTTPALNNEDILGKNSCT